LSHILEQGPLALGRAPLAVNEQIFLKILSIRQPSVPTLVFPFPTALGSGTSKPRVLARW